MRKKEQYSSASSKSQLGNNHHRNFLSISYNGEGNVDTMISSPVAYRHRMRLFRAISITIVTSFFYFHGTNRLKGVHPFALTRTTTATRTTTINGIRRMYPSSFRRFISPSSSSCLFSSSSSRLFLSTIVDGSNNNNVTNTEKARRTELLQSLPSELKKWLDMSVPEGRCLGILLKPSTKNDDGCFPRTDSDDDPSDEHDDSVLMTYTDDGIVLPSKSHQWMHSMFHPSEIALGMTLKCSRTSFWLGRLAIRTALDYPDYPILRDSFGRPMLSKGLFGSISHKQNKGVAIVSSTKRDEASGTVLAGIGIDLEMTSRPGRPSIAKKVLTEREQQSLGGLPGVDTDEEVLLRFSLKEAIYKAAHPLICQYVGFQEAEVTPAPDGSATCDWFLETKADQRISKLTAHWRRVSGDDDDGDFFLTTASVYAKPEEI